MQKIISTGVGSHFFPKKYLEGPKTLSQNYIDVLKKIENDLQNQLNPLLIACTMFECLNAHSVCPILDF